MMPNNSVETPRDAPSPAVALAKRAASLVLAFALFSPAGCSRGAAPPAAPGRDPSAALRAATGETGVAEVPAAAPIARGEAAVRLADRLRAKGGLRIATTATSLIYEPGPDGGFGGFHANLAAAFAAWLGVPMSIETVAFDSFFSVGGVVHRDPDEVRPGAAPELFRRVDLVVHSLARLPWRERVLRMVDVLPVRIMAITRRGEDLPSLLDLAGKRVVVPQSSSYEDLALELRERQGISFEIVPVPYDADVYRELAEGRADVVFRDADQVIHLASSYPDLSIGLPVSELAMNCWAAAPGDEDLAEALEEFLSLARIDGTFERIWREAFGTSLETYFGLIGYRRPRSLVLTGSQRRRIEEIRRRGGLRVAIGTELTIYEPGEGEPGGLHYALVRRLGEDLGLPIRINPVTFEQYWSVDGKVPSRAMTDPTYSYTPDLLKVSDLYVGSLSSLPWRRSFLRFVPMFPTTLVYLARKGLVLQKPADLLPLRVSLLPDTSYESWLRSKEAEIGKAFSYVVVTSVLEAVSAVAEGRADVTISDANLALVHLREFKDLVVYPASPEMDMICWAVALGDDDLASALDAWISAVKEDGSFELIWRGYYGYSFTEYLGMIGAEG